MASKLFVIVRADLDPGAQAVQAMHALQEHNQRYPSEVASWYSTSNTLALLSVPNEAALTRLLDQAVDLNIPVSAFREPDLGDVLTAIVLDPQGVRLTKNLPLALKCA